MTKVVLVLKVQQHTFPPLEATHGGHERDLGADVLNEALFTSGGAPLALG